MVKRTGSPAGAGVGERASIPKPRGSRSVSGSRARRARRPPRPLRVWTVDRPESGSTSFRWRAPDGSVRQKTEPVAGEAAAIAKAELQEALARDPSCGGDPLSYRATRHDPATMCKKDLAALDAVIARRAAAIRAAWTVDGFNARERALDEDRRSVLLLRARLDAEEGLADDDADEAPGRGARAA